jgi:hypothetical protein
MSENTVGIIDDDTREAECEEIMGFVKKSACGLVEAFLVLQQAQQAYDQARDLFLNVMDDDKGGGSSVVSLPLVCQSPTVEGEYLIDWKDGFLTVTEVTRL